MKRCSRFATVVLSMLALFGAKDSSTSLVRGHGHLRTPMSRNYVTRDGNENGLSAGGPAAVYGNGKYPNGKHGVCGDPAGGDRPHEAGGVKSNGGKIVATYKSGDTIDLEVVITANHWGKFQFRVCPLPRASMSPQEERAFATQACFNRNVLRNAGDGSDVYWVRETSAKSYRMRFKLPPGLNCDRCILQWYYLTGNSCVPKGVPQGLPGYSYRMGECGGNAANPEEFWNCADVKIGTGSTKRPPPTSPSKPPPKVKTKVATKPPIQQPVLPSSPTPSPKQKKNKTSPPPSPKQKKNKTSPKPSKTSPPPSKTSPPPSKTSPPPSKTSPPPSKTSPPPSKTSPKPSKTSPKPSKTSPKPSKTSPKPSKRKSRKSKKASQKKKKTPSAKRVVVRDVLSEPSATSSSGLGSAVISGIVAAIVVHVVIMVGLGMTVGIGIAAALTLTMGSLTAGTWTFLSSRPFSNNNNVTRREHFIRAFRGASHFVGGDWTAFRDWAHVQQNVLAAAHNNNTSPTPSSAFHYS
jgi:hypothetical protein